MKLPNVFYVGKHLFTIKMSDFDRKQLQDKGNNSDIILRIILVKNVSKRRKILQQSSCFPLFCNQ